MVTLDALWLPIVLSSVLVFVASSIVWMVLPHHRSDTRALGDEAGTLDVFARQALAPGLYRFPYTADMSAMGTPEFQEKARKALGYLTVLSPKDLAMGKSLALWFVYLLVVSTLVAYVAGRTLGVATPYLHVFRVTGTIAILAYGTSAIPNAIWWGRPWRVTFKEIADGVVYGLITAGCFGWLWPR